MPPSVQHAVTQRDFAAGGDCHREVDGARVLFFEVLVAADQLEFRFGVACAGLVDDADPRADILLIGLKRVLLS